MRVVRAAYAGACYGVQRALDLALKAVEDGGRAYTLGPLIHNPQVVAQLAERGVRAVDGVEDVAGAGTVAMWWWWGRRAIPRWKGSWRVRARPVRR